MKKGLFFTVMLVSLLALGLVLDGCENEMTEPTNPFNGRSWTVVTWTGSSGGAVIIFETNTWTLDNYGWSPPDDGLVLKDFRGNYTFSGRTAELTGTHYRMASSNEWVPAKSNWTATLDKNDKLTLYINSLTHYAWRQ